MSRDHANGMRMSRSCRTWRWPQIELLSVPCRGATPSTSTSGWTITSAARKSRQHWTTSGIQAGGRTRQPHSAYFVHRCSGPLRDQAPYCQVPGRTNFKRFSKHLNTSTAIIVKRLTHGGNTRLRRVSTKDIILYQWLEWQQSHSQHLQVCCQHVIIRGCDPVMVTCRE